MSKFSVVAGLAAALAVGVLMSAPVRAESVRKECGTEWKTAKADKTLKWPEFLKDCEARHAAATAAPASTAPAPAMTPSPTPTPTHAAKVAPAATGAGEFATEAEARGHCPSDTVVWVNKETHKYHYAGNRYYGKTKQGAFMCEADAKAGGDAASKHEKPKS